MNIFNNNGIEIKFKHRDDFLKIIETLTRIGIASKDNKTLFQSCHILHKQGKYAILSFKEMFLMDGKKSTITDEDYERRNTIVRLLAEWGLIELVTDISALKSAPMSQLKILPFNEKHKWKLIPKYNIGSKQY